MASDPASSASPVIDYGWQSATPHTEDYLLAPLRSLLWLAPPPDASPGTMLDLGCGNGALAEQLHQWGYQVEGLEPSPSGIAACRQRCPSLRFHQATAAPPCLHACSCSPSMRW